MFNKRLIRLETGHLAVVVDIELKDDVELPEGFGFSVTFRERTYSVNPTVLGNMAVVVNSEWFDVSEFAELIHISDESFQIDVVEIRQRSLEEIAILILKFIGDEALRSIIGASAILAGKKLFDRIKQLLDDRYRETGTEAVVQMHFDYQINEQNIPVVLTIVRSDLNLLQSELSIDDARKYVQEIVGDSIVKRVSLRLEGSPPTWRIDHFVDQNENTITL